MSESKQPATDVETVLIETLKLAAWLRLNGVQLLQRSLLPDGRVAYLFKRSSNVDSLVDRWSEKSEGELALSRFASLVSYEIRTALKLRRSRGLPLRLTGVDDAGSSAAHNLNVDR